MTSGAMANPDGLPIGELPAPTDAGRLSSDEERALYWTLGPTVNEAERHTAIGGHQQRERRWHLLPALHAVNDETGWISPSAIDEIAARLGLGAAEVYSVASFYDLFSLTERPARQVRACIDVACRAADPDLAHSLPDGVFESPCLGMCEQAPAAMISQGDTRVSIGRVDREGLTSWAARPDLPGVHDTAPPATSVPQAGTDGLVLLAHAGDDTPDLDRYLDRGGFDAVEAAWSMTAEAIIEAVEASGLIGRGGAGFPTATKWAAVARQPEQQRFLVCNADESEPGTFKDRTLIENDPFAVIESILIASRAIGAETAFVYLRGEYGRAWATLEFALSELAANPRTARFLSDHEIVLFRGAGAYICGEETAIFSSIEGYRGEPRSKPPFPFEVGLFGKPTAVNNVETLANIPPIVRAAASGTTWAADRRLFCLSGAVTHPGVYEVELGLTLGELIDMAGGLAPGAQLQAVLLGGAAGGFVGADELDLRLEHDAVREAGLTLGSGVVMVFDHNVDLVDQCLRIAEFFRHESCGQCTPCRVGTVRQHEALERLAAGGDVEFNKALLDEINQVMTDASICGLGQTAGSAISVAINKLGVFDER